ncbi:hypothetical protein RJ639_000999 [Escallonia herrerae]|uniref:GRAM domain-containing protein n=1 Tax=Escallonia herrerae TaxID=1293975 RepID=A0AA88XHN4_9ASTE|nr:hypothetical protein RJ639_000999 [Escallonia herrerae]
MDLIALEGDVVLVGVVPLLDTDLVDPCPHLGRHQLLEVADGVILVALHLDLLPQPIIQHHLDHLPSHKILTLSSLYSVTLKLPSVTQCDIVLYSVIPLHQLKAVNSSSSRANPAEKYIQVISIDNHEFWYMGFLNYEGAVKSLEEALQARILQSV